MNLESTLDDGPRGSHTVGHVDMTTAASEPSGVGSELVAGLIGAGVAVACLLPPIVHLVSGPLGPAIGGFVGSSRVRAGARAKSIVAATIATTFAAAVAGVLGIATHVAARGELPSFVPTTRAGILGVAAVVWGYAAAVAFVGTVIRGAAAEKKEKAEAEAAETPGEDEA